MKKKRTEGGRTYLDRWSMLWDVVSAPDVLEGLWDIVTKLLMLFVPSWAEEENIIS